MRQSIGEQRDLRESRASLLRRQQIKTTTAAVGEHPHTDVYCRPVCLRCHRSARPNLNAFLPLRQQRWLDIGPV